jgi:hypothetical protein
MRKGAGKVDRGGFTQFRVRIVDRPKRFLWVVCCGRCAWHAYFPDVGIAPLVRKAHSAGCPARRAGRQTA